MQASFYPSFNDRRHISCFYLWFYSEANLLCSDGFLEQLLTYSGVPECPRFPSLSVVPSWDSYNYLYNYPILSLSRPPVLLSLDNVKVRIPCLGPVFLCIGKWNHFLVQLRCPQFLRVIIALSVNGKVLISQECVQIVHFAFAQP